MPAEAPSARGTGEARAAGVEIVVKIGGGVLVHAEYLDGVLAALAAASHDRRLLVIPGGGPFADTVRNLHDRLALTEDTAHWMAILAMDQYAHVITERLPGATLVTAPAEICAALDAGRVPVLTPSPWMRASDPLPHTWDVTSDSIAAWVAGEVRARRLVLVKPPGVRMAVARECGSTAGREMEASHLVDPYFARALPPDVTPVIVTADQLASWRQGPPFARP
jgi:aspartokinase-like uncharacterized kinase